MKTSRSARALACLALAAFVVAVPGEARATGLALYPLDGNGVSRRVISRLHELLIEAAWQVADRDQRLEPREPMLVAGRCGGASAAKLACLARLAAGGVLLVGDAERQGNTVIVTLRLVDGRSRVSPEAWFRMNLTVLATGPVVQTLRELEAALEAGRLMRPEIHAAGPRSGEDAGSPPEVFPGLREKPAPTAAP